MKQRNNTLKQNIAFFVMVIFLLAMTYFTIYEGTHTIHECTGEDCPICHELHIAETFTRQITTMAAIAIGCFLFAVFYKEMETVMSCPVSGRNLVTDKVRIDD